ncbi:MAG: Gfo/Idh/MocA family oxidoreductase, partial [Planctomycetes bacterium]|nr:Gfo/Idh/MocA family oxidoreductase [Planctomycetota bacterium]
MKLPAPITRRRFIRKVSAGALILGAAPRLAPAFHAKGANDRIVLAVIGTGGMGGGHVNQLVGMEERENIRLAAVCDVFRERAKANAARCKGEAYEDYRKLLERKDIDAVVIATPDHWHAKMSIDSMLAGKHVYCQKPMTLTAEQAIEVRNTARKTGLKLQVGVQGTSNDAFWKAHQAIAEGRIGKVVWSQGSYCRNSREGEFNWPIDPAAGPSAEGDKHIDWDMWLGHELGLAPRVGFNPEHFFRFRKFWSYSGGVATDLLYHTLAPLVLMIAGRRGEYPLRAVAAGGIYVQKDTREIPDTFFIMLDYPSEHTIVLVSVMTNTSGLETRVCGNEGTLLLQDGVT